MSSCPQNRIPHYNTPIVHFDYFPQNLVLPHSPPPYFLTKKSIIHHRLRLLQNSLKIHWLGPSLIAYSFKTNYHLAQKIKFPLAEVVSHHELKLASNYNPSNIIFNGPHKGKLPFDQPYLLNLDNFSEISQIIRFRKPVKAKLGLRLNTQKHPSRFGFNLENGEAQKALDQLTQHRLPLAGIHFHAGSDIHTPSVYRQCSSAIAKFIRKNNLLSLQYLDFGGGFPGHGYKPSSQTQSLPDINQYLSAITTPLVPLFTGQIPTLILEPGRFLVDDSTVLVSQIINVVTTNSTQTLLVDATINMLPSTWYRPHIIQPLHPQNHPPLKTIIYGSSCQESDILFQGKLPPLSHHDLIVFYCVGAYNQSLTPSFIFPSPKTYLF